jgi:ATP-dependent DNA helicase RecG
MPGSRKKGYLLIGVRNNGEIDGQKVDDALMKKISGIRSDGNILPLPVMSTEKVVTDKGDVLVVEVTPSFDTPVRYRGRTFIRIGPRRDIASAEEERILSERCAASLPTFDTRPCCEAKLEDIEVDTIVREYMPKAIDAEVLTNDKRPLKEQLASLHLFNMQWDCPTYAALIMFGRNPRYFMPGSYIQYVHFKGSTNGSEILNERRFEGCLYKILPELENFIRDGIITRRPVPVSILREKDVLNYPYKALRELMMNAVMHRDYQANMPTRLYRYDNHIEVMNPGGLYCQARPENFPHVNDYRNSVVAGMMKTLNYVNMFNHGVGEVQDLLRANNSPAAEFNVSYMTAFNVVVKEPDETILPKLAHVNGKVNRADNEKVVMGLFQILSQACPSIAQVSPKQIFTMLDCCKEKKSLTELMEALSASSRRTFVRQIVNPFMEASLIELTHPENPRHPQQKYLLTERGAAWLKKLEEADEVADHHAS